MKLFPEIKDCLCVGQYSKDRDERAVLFLQIKEGFSFSEDLREQLRKRIAKELTDRHIPEVILEAPAIPVIYTLKAHQLFIPLFLMLICKNVFCRFKHCSFPCL